jgi:hypothetical protein
MAKKVRGAKKKAALKNTSTSKAMAKIRMAASDMAHSHTEDVARMAVEAIQEQIIGTGNYPVFADSITKRKNSSAPNPIAYGAVRDLVDSGDLFESVDYMEDGEGFLVFVDTPYSERLADQTDFVEIALRSAGLIGD